MRAQSLLTFVALLAVSLAGCSDGAPKADVAVQPEVFDEVEVTDTTGAIKGLVITEAIVPIEGVLVQLTGGLNATTDAEGAFVFSNLEPGDYFVSASKIGYETIQTATSVVAGVKDPPITRIALIPNPNEQPYFEVLQWNAFLQCGAGVPLGGSWNPCLFTGSDNVHYFEFGPGKIPTFGQVEAVWTGTQPLGNRLWMQFGIQSGVGDSPHIFSQTHEELDESAGDDDKDVMVRVFAGDEDPTLVINQAYDIYVSYFYSFAPRAGWTFINDGPCDNPEKCT